MAAGVMGLAACASAGGQKPRPPLNEAIKLDQVGYQPQRPKLALVTDARAAGAFTVRRVRDGSTALSGTLGPARSDPDTGDTVRAADFSALAESGSFYLDVEGVGASHEFDTGGGVYAQAFRLALRAFYGQRCGTAVDLSATHPGYMHAACHLCTGADRCAFHSSSGTSGAFTASGGWHDAGDYGKYVVNSGITTGQLLWAYELFPGRVGAVRLDIPESANDVPDVLDEARWNLEWMLAMQDADGGVWHKLTSLHFGSFVMPERDDAGPLYVVGTGRAPFKGSCASGDFAAVMAIAARVYRPFDPAFSARALRAAESAWTWLAAHPDVAFRNPTGVDTGEYGDGDCSDERLWAGAELFRTTGAAAYNDDFKARAGAVAASRSPASWSDVRPMALMAYALSRQPGTDEAVRGRVRAEVVALAEEAAARTQANAYRVSLRSTDYVWGSNGVVANYGMELAVADLLQTGRGFLDAAADDLHYLLGRNTFGLCWVTQLGDRPFRHPHHRPSGADANAEPWPGLLSGGPNRNGGDPVIDALPATPPGRRYRDDELSYASNEIAINWNAPLVFLLASLLPE